MFAYEKEILQLHPQLYRWSITLCDGDIDMAKEVLQEVYVKIWSGKALFKGYAQLQTWLFICIRNTAIDFYRKRKREWKFKDEWTKFNEPVDFSGAVEKNSNMDILLKKLSLMQRAVLQLVFYHQYTLQEVSEILNIKLGTAATHYKRGKERLKNLIEKNSKVYE